jgi:hypothetical protein
MPGLPVVFADGAAMPFGDRCADVLCFADSWYWLEEDRRATEPARVLATVVGGRHGGRTREQTASRGSGRTDRHRSRDRGTTRGA